MNKRIIYFIAWVAAVAALIVFFLYEPARVNLLLETPFILLVQLSCLVAITWLIVYAQSYITLVSIANRLPFFDYLLAFLVGLLINYSPIRVGIAARAFYLSKYHSINISTFTALSMFRLLVLILMSGLISGIAVLCLPIDISAADTLLLAFFLTCVIAPLAIFSSVWLNYWKYLPGRLVGSKLANFGRSFRHVNNKLEILPAISVLVFVQFFLVAVRMKLCFSYAGIDMELPTLMVLAPLGTLLSVLAITPAGIGVREFVVASVGVLLGFSFEQGMQALIIDRISMIIVALVLGGGSMPILLTRKTRGAKDDRNPETTKGME